MAKTKISEFSTTAGNNTDINSINIAEGCAPSGINDAIRELMRQLKEFQTGGAGDSVNSGGDFSVATNKFTVASASGNTAVAGTLGVTGTTTLTGALVANGNVTLGDASGDTVTLKGTPTLEVNPTLSGGTANGVLYLNGSKVATSGSALTFDGTNFSATGTTTVNSANSTQVALVVKGETGNGIRQNFIGQASSGQYNWQIGASITAAGNFSIIPSTAADGTTFSTAAYAITGTGTSIWSVSGSEAMRLTSTGLGIGTSSPGYKLDVVGTARIQSSSGYNFYFQTSGTTARINYLNDAFSANISAAYRATDFAWQKGDGSEVLKLDSSGNLGLGVTPSAWRTAGGEKVFQFDTASVYCNSENNVYLNSNWFLNSSAQSIYIESDYASSYGQVAGQHQWYTAASGTAGNAISFTQAMTLDASGNLGVGTTSPTGRLHIYGSDPAFRIQSSVSGNMQFGQWDGSNNRIQSSDRNFQLITTDAYPITFFTNSTERARIDSSGNFGIGNTTGLSGKLGVSGNISLSGAGTGNRYVALLDETNAYAGTLMLQAGGGSAAYGGAIVMYGASHATYPGSVYIGGSSGVTSAIVFGKGGNSGPAGGEFARIDTSGNLLVGTTSASGSGASSGKQVIQFAGASVNGLYLDDTRTTSGTDIPIIFGRGATEVGKIETTTSATAYQTSSDYRLKNNQQPLTGSGAFIDALQPKTWDWKVDGSKGVGFIAHEVQEVSPSTVSGTKDAVNADGKPIMQAMEYGSAEFIANIIAELQSLRKRLAAAGIA